MQIIMFITLGLLVFPKQLFPVAGLSLLFSLFIIFIARPLGIFISLMPFRMPNKEKLFISWVGLRGASPIVFAMYPVVAGVSKAETIFDIVFFMVLTSVIIQGTSIPLVAKLLGLISTEKIRLKQLTEFELSAEVKNQLVEIELPNDSSAIGKTIAQLNLSGKSLIVLIKRGEELITPKGKTQLLKNDKLVITSDNEEEMEKVRRLFL